MADLADEPMRYADYEKYLSPALAKSTDLVIDHGEGPYMWDVNGEKYLDFVSGIAVNALGHGNPAVRAAIHEQTDKLINGSFNMVNFPSTLRLAERIAHIAPGKLGCTMFANGGAEATDASLKLARAYTGRPAIIAFEGSFHGRTMGAMSVTGSSAKYRRTYQPCMPGVYFAPYPQKDLCPKEYDDEQRSAYCLQQIDNLFSYLVTPEEVAAILMEPVQGEGGYFVPPRSFVEGVRERCDTYGILLICDEIQSGYGRTGKMFACQNFDVVPDIMNLGKAIAGGLPMSATVSTHEIMSKWLPGMHGGTFGGNPVCAAAANAVLDEFERQNILANVNAMGDYLGARLEELRARHDVVGDARGIGLMRAIEFDHPEDGSPAPEIWGEVKAKALEHHLITLNCGVHYNGMRFATPLNVTKDVIDEGLSILDQSLDELGY
jgi:4-aminobutyrate aminotransferase